MILIKYSSLDDQQLKIISGLKELNDGFTIIKKSANGYEFYTFYNDLVGSARMRLTIAHEIKHVVFLEFSPSGKDENLANHFARYILAPTCFVMPYIGRFSPMKITGDFDISYEVACNAYNAAEQRILCNKSAMYGYENELIAGFIAKHKKPT